MYDEKLEQLIDAALADGELTEKEKQILFKKAQAMGMDLDEFEMVLDARLVKLQKAEAEKTASSAPKSNKFGDVKKCPACGAIVQSYQGVCSECGYAFENIQANLSSQKLAESIDMIIKENNEKKNKHREKLREKSNYYNSQSAQLAEDIKNMDKDAENRIMSLIKNYPIPNSKADLIEFITSLDGKTSDPKFRKAYIIKLNECKEKAKLLFSNDKDIQSLFSSFEERGNKKRKRIRTILTYTSVSIIILLLGCYFFIIKPSIYKRNDDRCSAAIEKALQEGNTQKAVDLFFDFKKHKPWLNDGAVESLIKTLLKEDDIETALRISDSHRGDQDYVCIYNYHINRGDYENAKAIYQSHLKDWDGTYIKDVITHLCEQGKTKEAQDFLKKNKENITNYDKLGPGRNNVIKKIQNIIDSYK